MPQVSLSHMISDLLSNGKMYCLSNPVVENFPNEIYLGYLADLTAQKYTSQGDNSAQFFQSSRSTEFFMLDYSNGVSPLPP